MTTTSTVDVNPSVSVYDALNAKAGTAKSANATTETEDRFLKLLVTQLKNQDPLNPMDNAQMTSQMAQISTVNGIEKLNTTLQAMMSNSSQSQTMQAAALVGKSVLVSGSGLSMQSGAAIGGVDLGGAADGVSVSIKDANGIVIRTLKLGAMEAGTHLFQWDGKSDSGALAADGNYSISVTAKQGTNDITANALQLGTVSSIMSSTQGVSLNVGALGTFKITDVKEIL
jgi:flagellar basal-body rod modification protein FlgD